MSYFVRVHEPDEIRRELLTTSKMVLGALRRYEHYRELRKAKLAASQELAREWNELNKLQRRLKAALPKTDIRPAPARKMQPVPAQPSPKPVQKAADKHREHKTKMQLLEEQLSKIEGKLTQLK